jgi:hypothetical protein
MSTTLYRFPVGASASGGPHRLWQSLLHFPRGTTTSTSGVVPSAGRQWDVTFPFLESLIRASTGCTWAVLNFTAVRKTFLDAGLHWYHPVRGGRAAFFHEWDSGGDQEEEGRRQGQRGWQHSNWRGWTQKAQGPGKEQGRDSTFKRDGKQGSSGGRAPSPFFPPLSAVGEGD